MTKYKNKKQRKIPKRKVELRNSKEAEAILIFMEANLMPQDPFKGVNHKWKSKCMKCGEIVFPRYADVAGGNGGCKPCGMKYRQTPEFISDLLNIMKNADLEPLEPFSRKDAKWKCKCLKCGNIVTPSANNVARGHGGCVFCQVAAFKHDKPAYLYVIHHELFSSYKVGIGNHQTVNDRIKSHQNAGWNLLKKYNFEEGKQAIKVEKKFFKWIRNDLKLPIHLSSSHFKHGGHSETFSDDSVTLIQIKDKLQALITGLQE